jgi:hypothetical protein
MTREPQARGAFGTVEKLPSGRYRVRYYADGKRLKAPTTFRTKTAAQKFLATVEADMIRNVFDAEREELCRRIEEAKEEAARQIAAESIDGSFDPAGCFVYILWGADPDRPVYVGQSSNVLGRIGEHMGDRGKRELTRRVQVIRCQDKAVMNQTEAQLIRALRPLLNIAGQEV